MTIKIIGIILAIVIVYFYFRDRIRLKVQLRKILLFPEVTYVLTQTPTRENSLEDHEEKINKYVQKISISQNSKYTNEVMEFDLIVPKDLDNLDVKKVLILFHGIRDKKEDWIDKGHIIENYIDLLESGEIGEMVFVIPNSGYSGEGWYTNFSNLAQFQYEEFFSKDLVPLLKEKYPKALLGITGFSMGGYGALKIGLKNLQSFEVIGSMAGAINLSRLIFKRRVLKVFKLMYMPKFLFNSFDKKHFIRVFGSFGKKILKEDPYTILKKCNKAQISNKKFYLSTGQKDAKPHYMFHQWIDCIGRMKAYNYDFKGVLYKEEGHTWDYIERDLRIFLKYFNDSIDERENKDKKRKP